MVCVVYSSLPLTILNFGASLANLAELAQNSKLLAAMDIPSPASEENFVPTLYEAYRLTWIIYVTIRTPKRGCEGKCQKNNTAGPE